MPDELPIHTISESEHFKVEESVDNPLKQGDASDVANANATSNEDVVNMPEIKSTEVVAPSPVPVVTPTVVTPVVSSPVTPNPNGGVVSSQPVMPSAAIPNVASNPPLSNITKLEE